MESTKHFNQIADSYERIRPVFTPLMDKLAEVLELNKGDIVVDYGCGPGHDIEYLKKEYKINPIGIDASNEMCVISSKKIGNDNVINGDNQYYLQNLSFDKIYFKVVMHHIKQPIQFIDDVISYLKPGSSIAIITMVPENLSSYIVLRYFPALRNILEKAAQKQNEIIEHILQNPLIQSKVFKHSVNEEIFDESLIDKIQHNYSSFISSLSEKEKNAGLEKLNEEINNNKTRVHLTKGVIYYGKRR